MPQKERGYLNSFGIASFLNVVMHKFSKSGNVVSDKK